MNFSEKKQEIISSINKKLREKGKTLVCPICGNTNFILAEGYSHDTLQNLPGGGLVIGGQVVPEVIVACNHCGHIVKFSAVVLGVVPKQEKKKEGKNDAPGNSQEDGTTGTKN